MIRRTFLKALCASPFAGLIPKTEFVKCSIERPLVSPTKRIGLEYPLDNYAEEMAKRLQASTDRMIIEALSR